MEKPIMTAIEKLILAGEQAGFSVEQMIQILQTGASVETLLHMICRWVMVGPLLQPSPCDVLMPISTQPEQHPVLSGWKEIASYLGRGVRTVQRHEHDFGLPVRRPRLVAQSIQGSPRHSGLLLF